MQQRAGPVDEKDLETRRRHGDGRNRRSSRRRAYAPKDGADVAGARVPRQVSNSAVVVDEEHVEVRGIAADGRERRVRRRGHGVRLRRANESRPFVVERRPVVHVDLSVREHGEKVRRDRVLGNGEDGEHRNEGPPIARFDRRIRDGVWPTRVGLPRVRVGIPRVPALSRVPVVLPHVPVAIPRAHVRRAALCVLGTHFAFRSFDAGVAFAIGRVAATAVAGAGGATRARADIGMRFWTDEQVSRAADELTRSQAGREDEQDAEVAPVGARRLQAMGSHEHESLFLFQK